MTLRRYQAACGKAALTGLLLSSGTNTEAGTGTGTTQTITVYGQVPAQTSPAPGSYADVVNVTVTF
jgi:spore coat protein U-like protein